jgi:N-acetylmuramoyl-L-alanine amidase
VVPTTAAEHFALLRARRDNLKEQRLDVFNSREARSHLHTLKIPLVSLTICLSLGAKLGVSQQSDEENRLRELFLKSRQQMEIVPSPTPTPKPRPNPAASPVKQSFAPPSPESTPRKPPQPGPTAKRVEREESEATPSASIASTPPQNSSTPTPQRETPAVTPKKKHHWFFFQHARDDSIVVQKSGAEEEKDLVPPTGGESGVRWQYLTPAVRKAIDDARVARNRWKYVIVHNSGTRQGNARIFDYYHRHIRKMPNGLAYHFVIGNGTSSGNGQIEIGNRWTRQLNGGHVHSDYLNYISIGICLVGDFNRDLPTKAEYEALDELIRYLRRRVGKVDGKYSIVRGHKEINPRPTDCPGNRFPLYWLHRSFPD